MLGLIGFIILSFFVFLFAYTSYFNYTLVPIREKRLFVSAFVLLGFASLLWAGTFLVNNQTVPSIVFASDILLIVASGCMLGIIFDLAKIRVFIPIVLAGTALLFLRAFIVTSPAYVADGLLFFNLSLNEAFVIGLIFITVWLPAVIKFVYLFLNTPALYLYRNIISFMFISVIMMTSLFLAARRPIMIILTMSSIIFMFALLVVFNLILKKINKTNKKKR